jgi:hypothetical protein
VTLKAKHRIKESKAAIIIQRSWRTYFHLMARKLTIINRNKTLASFISSDLRNMLIDDPRCSHWAFSSDRRLFMDLEAQHSAERAFHGTMKSRKQRLQVSRSRKNMLDNQRRVSGTFDVRSDSFTDGGGSCEGSGGSGDGSDQMLNKRPYNNDASKNNIKDKSKTSSESFRPRFKSAPTVSSSSGRLKNLYLFQLISLLVVVVVVVENNHLLCHPHQTPHPQQMIR